MLECLRRNTYDQFYNEHIYVFSTIALKKILKKFKLEKSIGWKIAIIKKINQFSILIETEDKLNGVIESPQYGEAHFDVEVNDNGQYSFNDSEYGIYNAHGNFEKGTGDQREFKDELEEMIYNFGLEWEYTQNFVMRLGFIYDLQGEIKNPTFGAGLNFNNYGFDFGYTAGDKGHPRENTMFFSLSMGL